MKKKTIEGGKIHNKTPKPGEKIGSVTTPKTEGGSEERTTPSYEVVEEKTAKKVYLKIPYDITELSKGNLKASVSVINRKTGETETGWSIAWIVSREKVSTETSIFIKNVTTDRRGVVSVLVKAKKPGFGLIKKTLLLFTKTSE